jgi:hypothetical protein
VIRDWGPDRLESGYKQVFLGIGSKEASMEWSVLSGIKTAMDHGPGVWDSLSGMVFVASASCTLHNDKAKALGLS